VIISGIQPHGVYAVGATITPFVVFASFCSNFLAPTELGQKQVVNLLKLKEGIYATG
jgi:hypothetical protein